ncbi:preprotein translocase subunit SecG [Vibrio mangrovi]|uniref:Protein-export membrane protein SecG n=1 Tax=Vibrio mangrovi TaxID=474394 RepID=A0A1Y6IUG1_9VIBR|nr:preprotein translocase subunit SecG [Vibrio mangrovi]MDW6003067.1 preprotein translocase subunit SecG [Vibrio mangrovi]SMS01309.1 Protein-export membrane protein SecG [Vibrio mangrovi]
MFTALLVIYLLAAVAIIGLVLIQQGKGADMGASFGAGASNTVFGASGSGNFLTRMTAIFATVFLVISLVLGNLSTHKAKSQWVDPAQSQEVQEQAPADNGAIPADKSNGSEIPQ